MIAVHDAHPVRSEGSIVVFEGIDDAGEVVWFGVDHREAPDVAQAARDGWNVAIEGWQILGRTETVDPRDGDPEHGWDYDYDPDPSAMERQYERELDR